MKKMLIAFAFVAMMCACGEQASQVPQDFPKKEFYPYAPYIMGDTVRFTNGDTIVSYSVDGAYWRYEGRILGENNIQENAQKIARLSGKEGTVGQIELSIACMNREEFHINLDCGPSPYSVHLWYTKDVLYMGADTIDVTTIFRAFVDEITLIDDNSAPKALIKKGVGIVWFEDYFGTKWTLVQE